MYYFVKIRLDLNQLAVYGQKLASGALTTHPLHTWCLQEDPAVGLNIWQAGNREEFEKAFAPHREFYAQVLEVTPVITAAEAQKILVEQLAADT